jgi:hypothetical protein
MMKSWNFLPEHSVYALSKRKGKQPQKYFNETKMLYM